MNILLTGANGYIGKRLLPALVDDGHSVTCLVRDPSRLSLPTVLAERVRVVTGDLLDPHSLAALPGDLEIAYYLVHSMSNTGRDFVDLEARCAANFGARARKLELRQIVYLSGLATDADQSDHMRSRRRVEEILRDSGVPLTVLRAGIIIGSGSASFEIIRDTVEKLPVMITPRWVETRTQPIAIHDVLVYLRAVPGRADCLDRVFEIGGPDVLTYKEMLQRFAKVRGLRRLIVSVPVLTPRLSAYWLFFVTSTSFSLARSLVASLKTEAVCSSRDIESVIPHTCFDYETSVERAFTRIAENAVVSSWKDAWVSGVLSGRRGDFVQVPEHGVLSDSRDVRFSRPPREVAANVWAIGGARGYYGLDWLWGIRGFLDKLVGGVGLRRGRTNPDRLDPGDALDFWRVLLADEASMRLLLFAEMKLPGDAWLEFAVTPDEGGGGTLRQTATFRPNGILGRLYWYAVMPFHFFVFGIMVRRIAKYREQLEINREQ